MKFEPLTNTKKQINHSPYHTGGLSFICKLQPHLGELLPLVRLDLTILIVLCSSHKSKMKIKEFCRTGESHLSPADLLDEMLILIQTGPK